MMTVLVTGTGGFVGSASALTLKERGHGAALALSQLLYRQAPQHLQLLNRAAAATQCTLSWAGWLTDEEKAGFEVKHTVSARIWQVDIAAV